MSVNLTGELACGPGDGGFFGSSVVAYERPVRAGVAVGEGCCPRQVKPAQKRSNVNEMANVLRWLKTEIICDGKRRVDSSLAPTPQTEVVGELS